MFLPTGPIQSIIFPQSRKEFFKAGNNVISPRNMSTQSVATIFSSVFSSNLSHSILRDWPDILISLQHSAWVMLNTGFSFTWKVEQLVRR